MTSIPASSAAPSSALLVKLAARPDFSAIEQMPRGAGRKAAAYGAITATAKQSQAPLLELAERLKNDGAISGYETLASPNMLVVTPVGGATQAVADAFRGAEGVKAIYSNEDGARLVHGGQVIPGVPSDVPAPRFDVVEELTQLVAPPKARPYGIDLIGAPAAWEQGADGEGLVYGSIDSGVDVTHEAIADRYRGRAADGSLDHDYSWFDPSGSTVPSDEYGHGTHTIGTAVGAGGIGVAPKAKFIAAAGLSAEIDGTLRTLQWMLAPTRIDGSDPDPAMAPDVVGMSWSSGPSSGDLYLESIQDLRAAGIEPVKSAGNYGPLAASISSPGQYPELIAIGAVDSDGKVAKFSSRGPAPYPAGSTTPKPDFAAPGVDTISSTPGNRYSRMSGTSMAQPHVSGAILAILTRHPELSHEQLTEVLAAGAIDKGAPGLDPEYGAGLIDIPAALAAAAKLPTRP